MWTRKAETLSKLKFVMSHPRANGKTWVMVHGIANSEGGAVVIVPNLDYARYIDKECRNPRIKYVALNNLDRLNGNRLPVVVDHTTVAYVLQYAFDMLNELQEENALLKSEVHALKEYKDEKSGQNSKDKAAGRKVRDATGRRAVHR